MSALARAEREYFEQPTGADVPNQHTDVVCPFNPAAMCTCGTEFASHHLNTYGGFMNADPRDLFEWICPEPIDDAHGLRLVAGSFDPEDDEDLGCPIATDCTVCDVRICSDHSDGFSTCLEGLHHLDCALACRECTTTTARTHP